MSSSEIIPLSIPSLKGNELKYLKECVETNFVSTAGPFVGRFEQAFANYVGRPEAVSVMNGTAALHLCLLDCGVSAGHEVLVPNLTFVASLNAISYTGANPVLLDSCWENLGIDPRKLEHFLKKYCEITPLGCLNKRTGKVIKAIMPVHIFGAPCSIHEIVEITRPYQIKVIEDATESVGSRLAGTHMGTVGDYGCFSFNGNKIMTSGGGGMIVSQHSLNPIRHLATTAKVDTVEFVHDQVGYNYRMVNLLAAVGLAQLEQVDGFVKIKQENYLKYEARLNHVDGVELYQPTNDTQANHWFYALRIPGCSSAQRKHIVHELIDQGIQARPIWALMGELPMYKHCFSDDLSASMQMRNEIINLPCSVDLTDEQIDRTVDAISKLV